MAVYGAFRFQATGNRQQATGNKQGGMQMKKTSIVWMVMGLAGVSQASVIYSNNFSGTEFKAAGIPAGAYSTAQNSSSGVLEATASNNTAGFRVALTNLNLSTLTAIKVSADVKIPATGNGTIFLGFGNESTDNNLNSNGDGIIAFVAANKKISVYGGAGGSNSAVVSASNLFPLGTTFKAEFTYYTNNTVDVAIGGAPLYTGLAVTSTVGNNLDYVYLNLRLQNTAVGGGATFDNLTITTIPEPATISMLVLASVFILILRPRMTA
jgi:hypothetical protein